MVMAAGGVVEGGQQLVKLTKKGASWSKVKGLQVKVYGCVGGGLLVL